MSSAATIVANLKQNGQDFEFYPTTREIIEAMYWELLGTKKDESYYRLEGKKYSIIDIGAGNCKLLKTFQQIANEQPLLNEYFIHPDKSKSYRNPSERNANKVSFSKYMVMEKSQILLDSMPDNAVVVGTDFWENTLLDKKADIIFCNPPYQEYAQWTARIIKEANAGYIYLVIPKRWGKNGEIAQALKQRRARVKIIGDFDFINAEDRKARAFVSLVKVDLVHGYFSRKRKRTYRSDVFEPCIDPFKLWFDETFKIDAKKDNEEWRERGKEAAQHKEKIDNALVAGKDLVETLVELYNNELNTLISNYLKVSELDSAILKELNVNVKSVLEAFREKISTLKAIYWKEIFDNMSEITSRLTTSTRSSLLGTLASNTNIDFTSGNIRSVVIWVIKNANKYFEAQMLEMYDTFTSDEGIKLYKSNAHWQKDSWRYNRMKHELKEKGVKYALDYRIVLSGYRQSYENDRLPSSQVQWIEDIMVIAKNFGFSIDRDSVNHKLKAGEKSSIYFNIPQNRKLEKGQKTHLGKIEDVFYIEDKAMYQYMIDGDWMHFSYAKTDEDIFTTTRSFKNGNIHFQFNQEFIKKFNLEVGRLKGWIKSPQEASEEMDISIEEATKYWKSSFTLLPSHVANLLPNITFQEETKSEDKVEKKAIQKGQPSLFGNEVA